MTLLANKWDFQEEGMQVLPNLKFEQDSWLDMSTSTMILLKHTTVYGEAQPTSQPSAGGLKLTFLPSTSSWWCHFF